MVSRRISHFSVAEYLGCGAPNSLTKASATCDMRFGCDILPTSIRGFTCLFVRWNLFCCSLIPHRTVQCRRATWRDLHPLRDRQEDWESSVNSRSSHGSSVDKPQSTMSVLLAYCCMAARYGLHMPGRREQEQELYWPHKKYIQILIRSLMLPFSVNKKQIKSRTVYVT